MPTSADPIAAPPLSPPPLGRIAVLGADATARLAVIRELEGFGAELVDVEAAELLILIGDAAALDAGLPALRLGATTATDGVASLPWPVEPQVLRTVVRGELALAKARQQVASAHRVRDEFLSTLSHELRTPLNAILGWSDILLRMPRDGDFQQGLQAIDRNAKAQAQLLSDLIDVSRLEAGTLQLDLETIDAGPICEAALNALKSQAEARAIDLQCRIGCSPLTFKADPGRLQQALHHLVANAIKFTPKQGKVDIELALQDTELVIRVCDNGRGIDAERLQHLRSGTPPGGKSARAFGLGLGLRLAREVARLHGGRLEVQSEGSNRGSCFSLHLPIGDFAP